MVPYAPKVDEVEKGRMAREQAVYEVVTGEAAAEEREEATEGRRRRAG